MRRFMIDDFEYMSISITSVLMPIERRMCKIEVHTVTPLHPTSPIYTGEIWLNPRNRLCYHEVNGKIVRKINIKALY